MCACFLTGLFSYKIIYKCAYLRISSSLDIEELSDCYCTFFIPISTFSSSISNSFGVIRTRTYPDCIQTGVYARRALIPPKRQRKILCNLEPSKTVPKPASMATDEDGYKVNGKRNHTNSFVEGCQNCANNVTSVALAVSALLAVYAAILVHKTLLMAFWACRDA